ncbi:MAG: response regulator [Ignavibacteriales bacterium]|nr:response regulator [Ignavibacteriales bacterium]
MKINHRIILVNLLIVAIVLGSSAIAFYTIMYNTLTAQQSKIIINSSRNFIFNYRSFIDDMDEEFWTINNDNPELLFEKPLALGNINDFFLEASLSDSSRILRHNSKNFILLPKQIFTIEEFIQLNPYAIINIKKISPDRICYSGKVINNDVLDDFSQKIGSDVALVWDNFTAEVSNSNLNSQHTFLLSKAYNYLNQRNDLEVFVGSSETSDIIATSYRIEKLSKYGNDLAFIFFKSHSEATDLRETLRNILILIGVVGIILALILSYVLTHKLRVRISDLNYATAQTSAGNFDTRIEIKSNDEIGKLGKAFNIMLDELKKNQQAKNDYSEFITLINKNASLAEISNAALNKIIDTCGFLVGALYSIDEDEVSLICSYGLASANPQRERNEFYKKIIKTKESIEISSNTALPSIQTGTFDLKISYLLLLPVIYNNKVIAILELASIDKPTLDAKDYLEKIKEQLAIGLTNAKAVVQLENFVNELKLLNEEYQKQNIQIKKQHNALLEMSNQLKNKAEELAIQKEKAEDSTKLKSQFLASMSHELRTPMNSILGLTELILDKAQLSQKNKERLEVVLKSGKRLMSLINDILDLSKIEAGKMEIREEDILLEEIIEDVFNTASPLALEKGLEFNIKRNCNTRFIINTDRVRVTQVLINLIGNAIKFTQQGKVELSITLNQERMLLFSVSDTGIGISEENRKIIFEEFRQIDATTTRKYSGTGLGLAISKKILDLIGGKIWVASIEGEGSVFSFIIPLKYEQEKRTVSISPVNVDVLRRNVKNPVLVIDDDPEVRYTIGQYLISKGYEVLFAENGEAGVKLAIERQPFAITLDLLLPNKDGWSILKELKEDPITKDIPVILVSIIGDKNVGYGLGAFEYFVKPISADKLLSAFTKLESLAKKRIQKIVIVDDDELEFEKFKNEFKGENITIEYIQDSEFAFNKIAEVQPDLIILDLMMPKIDGITLSHKLKSSSKTKQIPIIISTAKDLSNEEHISLKEIVEDITIKSKGNPLDVLKTVRDRIKLQEDDDTVLSDCENEVENNSTTYSEEEPIGDIYGEVLIVDDDADTLFTLNEMVQSTGCKTHLAKSGKECLKILESVKPDLIMLDIMMPEMDGFQTLKNIRGNSDLRSVPIYAVTAKAMVGDKEIILKHGFNDYIPKPVNSTIISSKIAQLFSKIKSR